MLGVHGIRSVPRIRSRVIRAASRYGRQGGCRAFTTGRRLPQGLSTTGETGIWFPAVLTVYRHIVSLAGEIDSPTERKLALAVRRLLDRQQHAKRREATERRLKRAFDAYEAAGSAFADQAPRLEAAAQRIGREREPLHARDAQRGTQAMKAVAIAGGDERRDRLVGIVGVAARIGAAVLEHVGRGAHGLVMKEPVERGAAPGDRRLDHEHASARPQHPRRLAEEDEWKFEMMQHVDHDDIGRAGVRERKPLGVRHAVEPWRGLDIGRNHLGQPALEVADAAADFDGAADPAGGGDASVEILVDEAQDRLALPHAAVVRELIGCRLLHHIALMRMNANNTMRSSMKPCRKREIWVSP